MNKHKAWHNQLILGDCLEIMQDFPTAVADMGLNDLPFGITRNAWDSIVPIEPLFELYNRIIKVNGAHLHFASQPFDKMLGYEGGKIVPYKYDWIWEKNKATGHLNAKIAPMRAHENILVFYHKTPFYNPYDHERSGSYDGYKFSGHDPMHAVKPSLKVIPKRNYGESKVVGNKGGSVDRKPRTVLRFPVINNDNPEKWHPTQKPVSLLEYFIMTYTRPGDLVLDNAAGSGSTAIACMNTGRKYLLIEKNRGFYTKAKRRIEKYKQENGID